MERIYELNSNNSFDRALLILQHELNQKSACPLLGVFPAALTIVISSVIAVVSVIIAVLAAIPALFSEKGKEAFKFGGRHFFNALENIGLAPLRMIPFVGALMIDLSELDHNRLMLKH